MNSALILLAALAPPEAPVPADVVYGDAVHRVAATLPDDDRLWVREDDLERVSGFTLKEAGLCRDDVCVPVPDDRRDDFVRDVDATRWVDLTRLAAVTGRVSAFAPAPRTWLFSAPARARAPVDERPRAPDFTLPDRHGDPVRLSDFRGEKVLLLTWASW